MQDLTPYAEIMIRRIAACSTALGLVAATPAAAQMQMQQMHPPQPVIVTRGEATVKRAPDQAFVAIASESRAPTPGDAQRLAAEAMTAVQAALKTASIPADAIRTTGYSLQPDIEYQSGRQRVRGYIARNQIEVRVDVLDRIGSVIDAAGQSGATSIAGMRFDLKNRRAAEQEALKLAVEDAMGRAKALASGAGATLGPIVRIEEQLSERPPIPYMPMRAEAVTAAAPPTPVSPGELEIQAHVTLTVSIK
jgi:uncharacterized protein YggE